MHWDIHCTIIKFCNSWWLQKFGGCSPLLPAQGLWIYNMCWLMLCIWWTLRGYGSEPWYPEFTQRNSAYRWMFWPAWAKQSCTKNCQHWQPPFLDTSGRWRETWVSPWTMVIFHDFMTSLCQIWLPGDTRDHSSSQLQVHLLQGHSQRWTAYPYAGEAVECLPSQMPRLGGRNSGITL